MMKKSIITIFLTAVILVLLKDFFILENSFDYKVFITISACSYMLMYKIIQYLAKLKVEEDHSRIDIVFVFFVVLFVAIPALHINKDTISKRENRVLARYNHFFEDGKINYDYGKDFENWFNDRFFGRNFFTKAGKFIDSKLNRVYSTDKAMVGKDGWLYIKRYNAVAMFQNDNLFTPKELVQIKANLDEFSQWCKENHVKPYFLLIPDKETIYPEFYPDGHGKVNDMSRIEQSVEFIRENSDIPVIYPYSEMMNAKAKGEKVYNKTGTHWSDIGAYTGYRALFDRIKQDFPNLPVMTDKDFNFTYEKKLDTDIAFMLMIDAFKEYPDSELTNKVYNVKVKDYTYERVDYDNMQQGSLETFISTNPSKKLKAVLFSDSFFWQCSKYVGKSFGKLSYFSIGYGKDFDLVKNSEMIYDTKPDILIISSTERFLQRLLNIHAPKREEH